MPSFSMVFQGLEIEMVQNPDHDELMAVLQAEFATGPCFLFDAPWIYVWIASIAAGNDGNEMTQDTEECHQLAQ